MEDEIGRKDKFVEIPWANIVQHDNCGRGRKNWTTTNFYTTNLIQNDRFNSVMRERTGWAAYMQQKHKLSLGETNDYMDTFAKLDDEFIMDIIETYNDELGNIYLVLGNMPLLMLGGINNL